MGTKCANCGSEENIIYIDETYPFCQSCIARLDKFYGYPVLDNMPEKCPCCGSDVITGGYSGDMDVIDHDLAIAWGIDPETQDFDSVLPYCYVYEYASCYECAVQDMPYGRRYYFDMQEQCHLADKPLSPKEIKQKELEALESAGQQRLL